VWTLPIRSFVRNGNRSVNAIAIREWQACIVPRVGIETSRRVEPGIEAPPQGKKGEVTWLKNSFNVAAYGTTA